MKSTVLRIESSVGVRDTKSRDALIEQHLDRDSIDVIHANSGPAKVRVQCGPVGVRVPAGGVKTGVVFCLSCKETSE